MSNRPILYRKYLGHTQSSYIVRSTLGYLNEDNDQEELVLTGSDHGYIYFEVYYWSIDYKNQRTRRVM